MEKAYTIESEANDIVIRLDRSKIDKGFISKWLDRLDTESIRERSEITDEQIKELADEVDAAVWEKVKHKYMD